MTNKELYDFLNNILIFLRGRNSPETILIIFISIEKPNNVNYHIQLSALDKLFKDKYINFEGNERNEVSSYYITVDGLFFINNGGYTITDNNIITKSLEAKNAHPTHDPNLWNLKCYELFKFLYDKYYTGKNTQLMNIWFFLKSNIGADFSPYPQRDLYLDFIFKHYKTKITNFDKPHNWFEKHLPILKGHLDNFNKNY